ncbi:MAG: chemotaxis protein CheW [Kangiella sp.]|nr:MAG: chemotaxis protein CheW [Kangiella sp.]
MADSKQTSSGSNDSSSGDSGANDLKTEVYSLMIPTINSHILLPNLSVAEIVPYSNVELFDESENKAHWFLGHLLWRGMHIPLISVDIIGGAKDPKANKRSRIAIVHTLNGNPDTPYLSIVVQGIPRLSHVTGINMRFVPSDDLAESEKMQVEVDSVLASIPDLDRLEEMVIDELATQE